jgi:two-component system, LytTR family, sensor kinase
MERRRLVHVQIAFWALYGTGRFLAVLPAVAPDERGAMAMANLIRAATGCLITTALWAMLRPTVAARRPAPWIGVGLLALVLGIALWPAFDRVVLIVSAALFGVEIPWLLFPRGLDLEYLILLLGWSAAATALLLWNTERLAMQALLEERAAAHEAQVRALAARLNPHFLFNSLNTISALIAEDADRARTTITRLSGFLRHALTVDATVPTTLGEEVDVVRDYLRIEETRFAPDITVDIQVAPAAAEILVPPLILQPLMENAVLHGEPGADGVLRIRLDAYVTKGALRLELVNSGRLGGGREGIGLELTRARLRQMYGDAQRLLLYERDGAVWAAIEIAAPLRRPPRTGAAP